MEAVICNLGPEYILFCFVALSLTNWCHLLFTITNLFVVLNCMHFANFCFKRLLIVTRAKRERKEPSLAKRRKRRRVERKERRARKKRISPLTGNWG